MSTIRANSITNSAGTGAPDFPNGVSVGGSAVTATAAELNVLDGITAIASQAEAEAGTSSTTLMTPQRAKQAIDALVGTAVAGLAFGAVGTYAFVYISNTGVTENSTYAGSSLSPAGIHSASTSVTADSTGTADMTRGSATLSGTWRVMARSNAGSGLTRSRAFLVLRIS